MTFCIHFIYAVIILINQIAVLRINDFIQFFYFIDPSLGTLELQVKFRSTSSFPPVDDRDRGPVTDAGWFPSTAKYEKF